MSNERDNPHEPERALDQLFSHVEPRPQPPANDAEEIRRAVLAEWEAVTGPRRRRRRTAFAAAASVLLAVGVWVGGGFDRGAPPVTMARVERIRGIVDDENGTPLSVGGAIAVGDTLATRTGQVALRLASGGSLRLGPRSEILFTSADSAQLVSGVLYFDSERRRAGSEFTVATALGIVRDVGTQFVVRLDGEEMGLDVGVRDGRIVLTIDGATEMAESGERLIAARDAPAIRREPMPTFGGDWEWTEMLAPPFDINGRTVSEFLAWFAEQTGRTVLFGSLAAERLARDTRLTGSMNLEPLQELSAVLALTDLKYALEGERVVIDTR